MEPGRAVLAGELSALTLAALSNSTGGTYSSTCPPCKSTTPRLIHKLIPSPPPATSFFGLKRDTSTCTRGGVAVSLPLPSADCNDGNDGVVKLLQRTPGAIAYASYDLVVKQRLSSVSLRNGTDTAYVSASEFSLRAAVLASGMYKTGDEATSLMNLPSPDAWPITLTTFILIDAEPKTAASAQAIVQFLYWTQLSGDRVLKDSGFAPFPSAIQARFAARLSSIRPKDGGGVSLR
jgi:hypothetical protein